jgi:TetR/AcrR family transcriptional regulator, regulator of cefoperazone and chloramphenicol sensitivity
MRRVSYVSEQVASERIRLVALDLFGRLGIDSVSMRQVAAAAGCTVGLVQHHFGTKDGLRVAVEEEIIEQFEFALSKGPRDRASRDARVQSLLVERPEIVDYLRRALLDQRGESAGILARLVVMSAGQVSEMRASGHARTDTSAEDQVLRMLIRQFGVLFLEPMVAGIWAELDQPETTCPELKVTLTKS